MSGEDHDPKADALLAAAAQGAPAEEIVADVSDEVEPASVRPSRRLTPPPKVSSGAPEAITSVPPARAFSSPRPPPPSKRHSSQPPPKAPLVPNIEPASELVAPENTEIPASLASLAAHVNPAFSSGSELPAESSAPALPTESSAPALPTENSSPAFPTEGSAPAGVSLPVNEEEKFRGPTEGGDQDVGNVESQQPPSEAADAHADSQKPVAPIAPPQKSPSLRMLAQPIAEGEVPAIPGSGKILASPILAMRIIVVGESSQPEASVSAAALSTAEKAPSDPPSSDPPSDPSFDGPADVTIDVEGPPAASLELRTELLVSDAPPAEVIEEADAETLLEQRRDKPPPPPKRQRPAGSAEERQRSQPPEKPKRRRPWWEELFSEDFLRAEKLLTDAQVKREVNFIENSLAMEAGGSVLDVGCGAGQHAAELASRGYGVVAYDLSLDQLALAAEVAQERAQKMSLLQGDMRELPFSETFDGIYCWNTSFGYFEEEKNIGVAQRMFQALKPGGRLVLDVANRDALASNTPCQVWYEGQRAVCMDDANLDFITSRLKVKRSVIMDDGRTRECNYSLRLYSLHELGKLLHDVGFRIAEASGHPATPGVFFGQSSPRIIILAQKP